MKYTYVLIAIFAIGVSAFAFSTNNDTENIETQYIHPNADEHYIVSDLDKAFPDYEIVNNALTRDLNFEKAKKDIKSTVKGTVIDISELKTWTDKTINPELVPIIGERIKIEVQIEVEKASKVYKKGDIVTVTLLGGLLPDGKTVAMDSDDEYELGEQVIIHLAEDPNDVAGKNVHYVKLGKYGKYSIQDDKAYNDANHKGKSIEKILKEAN